MNLAETMVSSMSSTSTFCFYFLPNSIDFNMISSWGSFGFGISQLLVLVVIFKAMKGGVKAEAKPWDGAHGLEWTVPSPAPHHTFEDPPPFDPAKAHG